MLYQFDVYREAEIKTQCARETRTNESVLETGILNEQRLQYATVCYGMLQYSSFGHQLQTRVVLWFQQKDLILTIPAREWHHSILIIFFGETTRI